jgi:hypothetical protein
MPPRDPHLRDLSWSLTIAHRSKDYTQPLSLIEGELRQVLSTTVDNLSRSYLLTIVYTLQLMVEDKTLTHAQLWDLHCTVEYLINADRRHRAKTHRDFTPRTIPEPKIPKKRGRPRKIRPTIPTGENP